MIGQRICPTLWIEVLYPITFQTSLPARLERRDPMPGLNEPIQSGKRMSHTKRSIGLLLRANHTKPIVKSTKAI
jgi:hypothetical protein